MKFKLNKIIDYILILFAYLGVLAISTMIISVMPGIIKGTIIIDDITIIKMLFCILIFFSIGSFFIFKNVDMKKLMKFNNLFMTVIYLLFLLYYYLFFNRPFVITNNIIPFKSIALFFYDFITLNKIGYLDLFKHIILKIFMYIPAGLIIINYLKSSNTDNNKNTSIFIIVLLILEFIKLLLGGQFNIDNIVLGYLGYSIASFLVRISSNINKSLV